MALVGICGAAGGKFMKALSTVGQTYQSAAMHRLTDKMLVNSAQRSLLSNGGFLFQHVIEYYDQSRNKSRVCS